MIIDQFANFTDKQLINKYKNGYNLAFDSLLNRYKNQLYSYLFRLTGNSQIAEDIFQDTFFKVLKNIANYKEQGKFSNWLFGIAHNLILDTMKRDKIKTKFFLQNDNIECAEETLKKIKEKEKTPDENLENNELKIIMLQAIDKLPFEQKQVVLLRHHSELSFKEIATILDRPLNTVLGQMRYALQNIKKILKEEYNGEISNVV